MCCAKSQSQPFLQLLGFVGKLSRVRPSGVLEFPLDRGHFREVRAGGRGPVRFHLDVFFVHHGFRMRVRPPLTRATQRLGPIFFPAASRARAAHGSESSSAQPTQRRKAFLLPACPEQRGENVRSQRSRGFHDQPGLLDFLVHAHLAQHLQQPAFGIGHNHPAGRFGPWIERKSLRQCRTEQFACRVARGEPLREPRRQLGLSWPPQAKGLSECHVMPQAHPRQSRLAANMETRCPAT